MKTAKQRRTTWNLTLIDLDGSVKHFKKYMRNLWTKSQYVMEPHWRKKERPRKRSRCKQRHDGVGPY